MNPKRPPPFSLRMTAGERARLKVAAKGKPLGPFLVACGQNAEIADRVHAQSSQSSQQILAQTLGLLGVTATILRDFAEASRTGTMDFDPETQIAIQGVCKDISVMKSLLMSALGLKEC